MPGETTLGQAWAELRWTQILPDFDATKAAITAEAGQIARAASDAAGGAAPSEDALLRWDRYSVMVRAASQAAMTGRLPFEYLFMVMREGKQIAAELSERGISPLVNSLGGFLSKLGPIGWGAAGLGAVFLMISSAANRAAEALRESEAALEKWEIEQSKVRREVWDIANPRQRPGSEKTQGDVATIEKALADTRTKLMELGKKPKEFVPGPGKPFESQMEQKKRLDRNRKIRELLKDEADFSAALRRGTAKGEAEDADEAAKAYLEREKQRTDIAADAAKARQEGMEREAETWLEAEAVKVRAVEESDRAIHSLQANRAREEVELLRQAGAEEEADRKAVDLSLMERLREIDELRQKAFALPPEERDATLNALRDEAQAAQDLAENLKDMVEFRRLGEELKAAVAEEGKPQYRMAGPTDISAWFAKARIASAAAGIESVSKAQPLSAAERKPTGTWEEEIAKNTEVIAGLLERQQERSYTATWQ